MESIDEHRASNPTELDLKLEIVLERIKMQKDCIVLWLWNRGKDTLNPCYGRSTEVEKLRIDCG